MPDNMTSDGIVMEGDFSIDVGDVSETGGSPTSEDRKIPVEYKNGNVKKYSEEKIAEKLANASSKLEAQEAALAERDKMIQELKRNLLGGQDVRIPKAPKAEEPRFNMEKETNRYMEEFGLSEEDAAALAETKHQQARNQAAQANKWHQPVESMASEMGRMRELMSELMLEKEIESIRKTPGYEDFSLDSPLVTEVCQEIGGANIPPKALAKLWYAKKLENGENEQDDYPAGGLGSAPRGPRRSGQSKADLQAARDHASQLLGVSTRERREMGWIRKG